MNLIRELQAKIADLQTQLKRAGEDKEKENSLFQTTVADQRATQKLLAGALNILKGFYDKAALVQKSTSKQEPAQIAYETFVTETNAALVQKSTSKQEPAGPPP